jgi:prevent-host-death family protein
MGDHMTVLEVSVRELKNQTTGILRRVEAGERVRVTRRGRVIAMLSPASEAERRPSDSIYQHLRRQIEARNPILRKRKAREAARDFDRISRKIARTIPYRDWREMDRALKGDRFGLSR